MALSHNFRYPNTKSRSKEECSKVKVLPINCNGLYCVCCKRCFERNYPDGSMVISKRKRITYIDKELKIIDMKICVACNEDFIRATISFGTQEERKNQLDKKKRADEAAAWPDNVSETARAVQNNQLWTYEDNWVKYP